MRNNDIAFFNLHRRYLNNVSQFGSFIGIYMLSAFLSQNGHYAQGYAGYMEEGKCLLDEICQAGKAQSIGLYCDYENVTENAYLSHYVKERYNLPVFVGGPQAAALDKEFIQDSGCDAIIHYEGEMTMLQLLDCFLDGVGELKDILGIAYLHNGEVVKNDSRPLITNLDSLPFVDDTCYLAGMPDREVLYIMTGRGCPFNCAFCHEGSLSCQVRFRSVENVLSEIDAFLAKTRHDKCPYILFVDDTFTLDVGRVKALCDGLQERMKKNPFNWFCEGHIHTLYRQPEMIDYLAEAGLLRLQLGIESGTQVVLDAYRKGDTVEEIRTVVHLCCEAGIPQICGNLILGGAFFSEETYENDLSFVKELISLSKGRLDIGVVSFWPLFGTSMTKYPEKYGIRILDKDFLTSVADFPQTETAALSRWDILWLMKRTWQEIEQYMLDMLRHDMIPRELIFSWLSASKNRYVQSAWGMCLNAHEDIFAYYSLLASQEAFSSDELHIVWDDAHPMRVLSMVSSLRNEPDRGIVLSGDGYKLSEWERDTLVMSTGKIPIRTIAVHLKKKYEEISMMEINKRTREALMVLEKHKAIVFCEC